MITTEIINKKKVSIFKKPENHKINGTKIY